VERRLAAILAADVVGYSRLMATDEAGTLARLNRLRTEVMEPKITQFHRRLGCGLFLAVNPHFSVRYWASTQPFEHEADRQHFVEGYIKAGLPMQGRQC
jgi:class 3 adenylate cyclase